MAISHTTWLAGSATLTWFLSWGSVQTVHSIVLYTHTIHEAPLTTTSQIKTHLLLPGIIMMHITHFLMYCSLSLSHSHYVLRRVKVACQVASALQYLHTGCRDIFVHRDIKRCSSTTPMHLSSVALSPHHMPSANILMSMDWSAALGDYGVLRIQPSAGAMMTSTVAGTPEYMDPEYIKSGLISEKTDVYSFGVVYRSDGK